MKLVFQGVVELGDPSRVGRDENGAIHVGGRDVIGEVGCADWSGPVTVAYADKRFSGPLEWNIGYGYSEWTPMESDALTVGEHDLIRELEQYEGEVITLWIADEPISILDDVAPPPTRDVAP